MAPTSTGRNKRQQSVAEPRENQMWTREGFDRAALRYEFTGNQAQAISLSDKYVQQDDQTFVDPRSIDMPVGPTAMGDVDGQGVEMFDIEGQRWPTFRWTQGFEVLQEDDPDVSEQRNAVMELFDFFSDIAFLTGIGPDGQYREGMFSWLRDAIPAEREIDCAEYEDDTRMQENPENIIKNLAFGQIDGRFMGTDNANWDTMVGSQSALATFNQVSGEDGGVSGDTYWERLSHETAMGGVSDYNMLPNHTAPTNVPYVDGEEGGDLVDKYKVNLVDQDQDNVEQDSDGGIIGTDEVYLIPSLEQAGTHYWRLHEMPTPQDFGPIEERGGKQAYDYAYRYTHRFNPKERSPNAADAIRLKNVSALFN